MALVEVGRTSRGYRIYREPNEAGGHCYWSDAIDGGVVIWDTCIASVEELEMAMRDRKMRLTNMTDRPPRSLPLAQALTPRQIELLLWQIVMDFGGGEISTAPADDINNRELLVFPGQGSGHVDLCANEPAIEFHVGDMVRQEFDDDSMGDAKIVAIAMDKAWCFYAKANCHRVHSLKRLQQLTT